MQEQTRETLPAAPSSEELLRRIQIGEEISQQIVLNSYKPENITEQMLNELGEEFTKIQSLIGLLGIELAQRQLTT